MRNLSSTLSTSSRLNSTVRRLATLTVPCLAICLALTLLQACSSEEKTNSIKIGVLLPYTGSSSAIAANMEKGALFATTLLNALATEDELPFEIVFANTAGAPEQASIAAQELVEAGVVAVVGPGGDETVEAVYGILTASGIPLISPLASTSIEGVGSTETLWFRLSSSTEVLGASLANVVSAAEGERGVGMVIASDDYHAGLAGAFVNQYTGILAGTLDAQIVIDESSVDTTALSQEVLNEYQQGASSFVLAMHPLPAAKLLTAVRSSLGPGEEGPNWFLTPRLKTEILVVNSSVLAVGHAVGVSSDIEADKIEAFSTAFDEEFGVAPLEPTYFVFDATLALLLSIDQLQKRGGELPADIQESFVDVTNFGGIIFDWTDLARAKELYAEGRTGQMIGLTGPIDFFADGERKIGTTNIWEFQDGEIVNIE